MLRLKQKQSRITNANEIELIILKISVCFCEPTEGFLIYLFSYMFVLIL